MSRESESTERLVDALTADPNAMVVLADYVAESLQGKSQPRPAETVEDPLLERMAEMMTDHLLEDGRLDAMLETALQARLFLVPASSLCRLFGCSDVRTVRNLLDQKGLEEVVLSQKVRGYPLGELTALLEESRSKAVGVAPPMVARLRLAMKRGVEGLKVVTGATMRAFQRRHGLDDDDMEEAA